MSGGDPPKVIKGLLTPYLAVYCCRGHCPNSQLTPRQDYYMLTGDADGVAAG